MKRHTSVAIITSLASILITTASTHATVTKGPHIQNLGKTGVTIIWETDAKVDGAVYLSPPKSTARRVDAPPPVKSDFKKNRRDPQCPVRTYYTYSVRLDGLQPGTEYSYRVTAGDETSNWTAFHTVPENPGKFTFIVYGDSQTLKQEPHRRLVAQFEKHHPDFIVHTGDFVTSGSDCDQWDTCYFQTMADIIDHIPVWATRGNHEGNGENLRRLFSPPDDSFRYSFDYGNAHFTVLSTSQRPEDVIWCDKDLTGSTAQWKFVFSHYPRFSLGWGGYGWGHEEFLPVIRKNDVDVTFAGHVHTYERFYPLARVTGSNHHPILHMVSGGGGGALMRSMPNPCIAKSQFGYNFLVVTVDGDVLTIEAFNDKNERFDSITIRKHDGKYDDEYLKLVRPEEVMTLHLALHNHALYDRMKINSHLTRGAITQEPGKDKPAKLIYRIVIPDLGRRAEVEISPSEQTTKDWIVEPAAVKKTIEPGKESTVEFKFSIQPRGKFTVDLKQHRISPSIMFGASYRIGDFEGTVPPCAVRYMPDLKTD